MAFANQPSGTVLTDWSISEASFPSGWNGDNVPQIVSDGAAPESPPYVGQATYPVGFPGGIGPIRWWYSGIPGGNYEFYSAWTWKCSDPWDAHPAGDKIHFLYSATNAWSHTVILRSLGGTRNSATLGWAIYYTNAVDNSHLDPAYYYGPQPGTLYLFGNVSNPVMVRGTWYRIEHRCKVSTTSTSQDGQVRLWINGALVISHDNLNYPRFPAAEFQFAPTWGGTEENKLQTDYFWYDHVRLVIPSGEEPPPSSGTFTSFTVS